MAKKEIDYRQLSEELDNILVDLQSSEIDIDKAIAKYERAVKILEQLEKYLKTAENKVKKIKPTDAGGDA